MRADAEYGSLSHRAVDEMDQGEGVEGAEPQGGPAGLRAVEGAQGGRGHVLGRALGPRPARAGTSSARRWPRSCSASGFEIHGGGNDLVFPHHENEAAQTRAARGAELAAIWMHNGMLQIGGEKMAKSVGNIALLPEVLDDVGRDALILFFAAAHYRQPIAFGDDALAEARRGVRTRPRGRARGWSTVRRRTTLAPQRDAFFAALADDFNTAAALAAAVRVGARGQPPRTTSRSAATTCARCSASSASQNLARAGERGGRPTARASCSRRARRPRGAGTSPRPTACATSCARAGWEVRDGPGGAELVRVEP